MGNHVSVRVAGSSGENLREEINLPPIAQSFTLEVIQEKCSSSQRADVGTITNFKDHFSRGDIGEQ